MSFISFYRVRDPFGCFSNFSRHGFELDGAHWTTSEHYYQAHKFADAATQDLIRLAKSPGDAARLGRDPNRLLRPDWEDVKDDVMQTAVLAKFAAHEDIRAILLSTGNIPIVENSPKDYYWGCGKDGNGKNKLGIVLMAVRELLRTKDNEICLH